MEEKLKSISKRIHWSLALRAGLFGLAWWIAPFWLFALIAFYLYFVPVFRSRRMAVPFFVLLILCYVQAPGVVFAAIFAVIFYYLLLIKNFLLIDRQSAYELLVLVEGFLLLREFYMRFNQGIEGGALFWSFWVALTLALLLRSFIRSFEEEVVVHGSARRAAVWLFLLLSWQILIAGLFLPLDFIYQASTVFLVVMLFVDSLPEYLMEGISRRKMLLAGSVIFALFMVVVTSARWGL